jgi:hypothetical protein
LFYVDGYRDPDLQFNNKQYLRRRLHVPDCTTSE